MQGEGESENERGREGKLRSRVPQTVHRGEVLSERGLEAKQHVLRPVLHPDPVSASRQEFGPTSPARPSCAPCVDCAARPPPTRAAVPRACPGRASPIPALVATRRASTAAGSRASCSSAWTFQTRSPDAACSSCPQVGSGQPTNVL